MMPLHHKMQLCIQLFDLKVPGHQEEQEKAHRQNYLNQQLENWCFEEDDEHFWEQLSVLMDMDLAASEPANTMAKKALLYRIFYGCKITVAHRIDGLPQQTSVTELLHMASEW